MHVGRGGAGRILAYCPALVQTVVLSGSVVSDSLRPHGL